MTVERVVMVFAGTFILASVSLSIYHSQNWLWLAGFVGLNLFQSAFTGFCPLAIILKKMGVQSGDIF
jgi:NADH:ubiquinone oxidoreductase subunit 5 (subunit L)/multisubunit Na+/H+ antiporter MnhA subunit